MKILPLYILMIVDNDIYSDALIRACNLTKKSGIAGKKQIRDWNLKNNNPLRKLRLTLVQGKNSEQIVAKGNTTGPTILAIAEDSEELGTLTISGVTWKIQNVKVL